MSLLYKSHGNAGLGLFLIRLTLGSLFLFAGADKVLDIQAFINEVKSLGIFGENLSMLLGFIIPFAEVLIGSLYIIGLFTPLTSLAIIFMCISFIFALGPGGAPTDLPFNYNFIFIAAAFTTLLAGAGKFSFDIFFDKPSKSEKPSSLKPLSEVEIIKSEIKTDSSFGKSDGFKNTQI
ncbi:MAG TPA: DoxX family protein [Ignavibacteria bacterium]|nr:DoxX family protein [Ignavibacteria bacterium]